MPNRLLLHFRMLPALLGLALLLVACGGGGGGSSGSVSPTPTVPSFDLQKAYLATLAPVKLNFQLTGSGSSGKQNITITGSGSVSTTAMAQGLLDNTPAQIQVATVTGTSLTSLGRNDLLDSRSTTYYDSQWQPLAQVSGSEIEIFYDWKTLPSAARVGDSGTLGSSKTYSSSDSKRSTVLGEATYRYRLDADGSSTDSAILVLVTEAPGASASASARSERSLRVSSLGSARLIRLQSNSVQDSNVNRLTLTFSGP